MSNNISTKREWGGEKIPNALLIGVQKSGTTALYDWISQHRDVHAPEYAKDNFSFFFNDDYLKNDLNSVEKIFGCKDVGKIVMAGNVNYIYFDYIAERIYSYNDKMKIIVMLRNPLERAYSAFTFAQERGMEKRSFYRAIREEIDSNFTCYTSFFEKAQKSYVEHGFYHRQISRYLEYFPAEQIYIGLYDDLLSNKEDLIKRIFHFLGLSSNEEVRFVRKNVTSGGYRFKIINDILFGERIRNNSIVRIISGFLSVKAKYKMKDMIGHINKKQLPKREMDPSCRQLLLEIYENDICNVQKLIGRDLSHWRS